MVCRAPLPRVGEGHTLGAEPEHSHVIYVVSDATGGTGWRVANVPVVVDMDLPYALSQADRRRIVALTIQPERLVKLRRARLGRLALED